MIRRLSFMLSCALCVSTSVAQESLPEERWFSLATANFQILSQLSRGQTQEQGQALEQWRTAAVQILGSTAPGAPDPLPNYVYLFDNDEDFGFFAGGPESSYFYSSPRSNFLMAGESEASIDLAKHHYSHFLINNRPVGLPRWYEEGMSHYLSRLSVDDGEVSLEAFERDEYALLASVNDALSLDALLYDDAALASPRLIQVANLKSGIFMHFLQHAHEYEGFADRRPQLQRYLEHLQESRTERFAYDQAFDISVAALERDFDRFLALMTETREGERSLFTVADLSDAGIEEAAPEYVALQLGELALHAGKFDLSGQYFASLMQQSPALGRAYSGFADVQRMQEREEGQPRPDVESLYLQAQSADGDDFQLYLDYGQFLDTELKDCEAGYPEPERARMQQTMQAQFTQALALNPESPEVLLSYAQLFTLPGADWQQGFPYHQQAFARLAADTFILEQAIDYAILEDRLSDAQRFVSRMSRPMHLWGEHPWITALNNKLRAAERGEVYDACAAPGL